MRKTTYILCGIVGVAIAATALLPARALTPFAQRLDGLTLTGTSGYWWNGDADAHYRGHSVGRWSWQFAPWQLFQGDLGFEWQLVDTDHQLAGTAALGFGSVAVVASGESGVATINRSLARYGIRLAGAFRLEQLSIRTKDEERTVAGTLRWNGGQTAYRLAGARIEVDLPPMVAELHTEAGHPKLSVRLARDRTPQLHATLEDDGWLRIDLTRRLVELAGRPWLGEGEDDDIVLSVREKVIL